MFDPTRPYTFDRVIRIIFTIVGVVGVFYVLNLLKSALLPFVVAWLLAYLINPYVLFCQKIMRLRSRVLAIIIALFSIVVVLTLVGIVLIPPIVSEFNKMIDVLRSLSHSSTMGPVVEQAWYQSLLDKLRLDELANLMSHEDLTKFIENSITHIWHFLSGSVNQIINIIGWFIVLLYLVFILIDYDRIFEGFKRLIPTQYRDITLTILGDVEDSMNRYFRGQSLIALIVGVLFSIGFVIAGIPLAIPLGLFVGLLNLVPYLQIVGFIPTILLCLLGSYNGDQSFWQLCAFSLIVFGVVQAIQDIYLTPKIMGQATGLNPAVILLSLSIWGSLLGMLGMIIALPLTTLLLAYYQKYIIGEKKKEIENEEENEIEEE